MKPDEINSQADVSVNGNMDGNIIVGNGNQINMADKISAEKVASELAIQRIKEEGRVLRKSCWEFIISDVMRETPSLFEMVAGKYNLHGQWFYNILSTFPNFKINGEKVKDTLDRREISEIIWNMSPQEIQQVLDYLPSRCSGKKLEGIKKFGETVLEYSKKIEKCRAELKRHKAIVEG